LAGLLFAFKGIGYVSLEKPTPQVGFLVSTGAVIGQY